MPILGSNTVNCKNFSVTIARRVPLTYTFPSAAPFQITGLPTFQSETISHPNMYCFVSSGLINTSQTFEEDEFILICFFTINSSIKKLVLKGFIDYGIVLSFSIVWINMKVQLHPLRFIPCF